MNIAVYKIRPTYNFKMTCFIVVIGLRLVRLALGTTGEELGWVDKSFGHLVE
jgi:hypothetical protein